MKATCNNCDWKLEGNDHDKLVYEFYKHNIEKHNMPKKVKIKIKQNYETTI